MSLPKDMRAVWYDRQGAAEDVLQLGELPTPVAGAGEVLVAISHSSVNPTDCNGRSGKLGRTMPAPRIVPNSDGAGTVVATGRGVDSAWIGRRVWIQCAQRQRPFGTAAEYCAVRLELVAEVPLGVSLEQAAGLGIPAMTAWMCLFQDGDLQGKTVLVTGGAGSVGHYAIQIARHGGATVLATISGPRKAAQARAAGAMVTIDYRLEDVAASALAATGGAGVDHVVDVDFGAGLASNITVLKPGGVIATYSSLSQREPVVDAYALMRKNIVCRFVLTADPPPGVRARGQAWIGDWLSHGQPVHRIAAVFALSHTAQAHRCVEEGARLGAVLIDLSR